MRLPSFLKDRISKKIHPTWRCSVSGMKLLLSWCIQHLFRTFLHLFDQVSYGAEHHTIGLAMFYTRRLSSPFGPGKTEITKVRWKREIIDGYFAGCFGHYMLRYFDPAFADLIIVLLLAGDFTRMTAGAIIVIYEQSISTHCEFSYSLILVSLTSVVLYCPPPKPESLCWPEGTS